MTPRTRVLVVSVVLAGAAIAARCGFVLAFANVPREWMVFGALTIASGFFTLKVPSIDSRLSISELFAFACVLQFGPEAGAVTLALDGIFISIRHRLSFAQAVFNFGMLLLSVWASGVVFFALSGTRPFYFGDPVTARVIVPLGAMTATYFGINSGLTATAVAFSARRRISEIWREHFLPLLPSYFAAASVALLLAVALRVVHFGAVALILPLLVISYLTFRSSFGRLEDSKQHVSALNRLLLSTVETLATAIDAKDEVTHDHVRRVQQGTLALARELGVSDAEALKALEAAALLHDTGKIAVPEHILNKPGKLTAAEFEKMKLHAPIGAEILSSIEFPYPVVPIVRHHHENWDGTGYPDGLKGSDIPLGARILSVVDCYDALTSDRPYRRRMTDEQALKIITDRRGTMYDPLVVDTFVATYQRIMPAPETAPHPVARVIGDARAQDRREMLSRESQGRRWRCNRRLAGGHQPVACPDRPGRRGRRGGADLDDRPAGPAVRGDGDLPARRAHRSDCDPLRGRPERDGAARHQPTQRIRHRRMGRGQPARGGERRRRARPRHARRRHVAGAARLSRGTANRRRRAGRGPRPLS